MRQWRREKALELNMEQHHVLDGDVIEWSARNPGRDFPPWIAEHIRNWQARILLPGFLKQFAVS
jgi:hypothetical protein